MADSIKLFYFNLDARALAMRMMLNMAGVEYEDERMSVVAENFRQVWGNRKAEQPLSQVPVLEVNGEKYPQTTAINNYIARKYGFIGSTERDAFICDVINESANELMTDTALNIRIFVTFKFKEYPGDDVIAANKRDIIEKFNRLAKLIRTYQREADYDKYILGDKVSAADVYFYSILSFITQDIPEFKPDDWIKSWELRFLSDTGVSKYMEIKPKADFET